jgi:hypothetical protein
MDVTQPLHSKKRVFWPLFETAKARFPFHITTAVRTRTGTEVGMHGVLHKWICASRAVGSNESGYRKLGPLPRKRRSLAEHPIVILFLQTE